MGPQSRARGLTRAILDTFPVVKFGRADAGLPDAPAPPKDIESVDHTAAAVPATRMWGEGAGTGMGTGKGVESAGAGDERRSEPAIVPMS